MRGARAPVRCKAGAAQARRGTRISRVHRCFGPAGRTDCAIATDGVVLSMIEDVKHFPAELEAHPLLDRKLLEKTGVKVKSPREVQRVSSHIPESQTRW